MFCEQCGAKIEENKRFCSICEEKNTIIIEIPKSDIISINGKNIKSKNNGKIILLKLASIVFVIILTNIISLLLMFVIRLVSVTNQIWLQVIPFPSFGLSVFIGILLFKKIQRKIDEDNV